MNRNNGHCYIHIIEQGMGTRVMEFDKKTTGILERVKCNYDQKSSDLYLLNEHGFILRNDAIVDNGRTYRVIRKPRSYEERNYSTLFHTS